MPLNHDVRARLEQAETIADTLDAWLDLAETYHDLLHDDVSVRRCLHESERHAPRVFGSLVRIGACWANLSPETGETRRLLEDARRRATTVRDLLQLASIWAEVVGNLDEWRNALRGAASFAKEADEWIAIAAAWLRAPAEKSGLLECLAEMRKTKSSLPFVQACYEHVGERYDAALCRAELERVGPKWAWDWDWDKLATKLWNLTRHRGWVRRFLRIAEAHAHSSKQWCSLADTWTRVLDENLDDRFDRRADVRRCLIGAERDASSTDDWCYLASWYSDPADRALCEHCLDQAVQRANTLKAWASVARWRPSVHVIGKAAECAHEFTELLTVADIAASQPSTAAIAKSLLERAEMAAQFEGQWEEIARLWNMVGESARSDRCLQRGQADRAYLEQGRTLDDILTQLYSGQHTTYECDADAIFRKYTRYASRADYLARDPQQPAGAEPTDSDARTLAYALILEDAERRGYSAPDILSIARTRAQERDPVLERLYQSFKQQGALNPVTRLTRLLDAFELGATNRGDTLAFFEQIKQDFEQIKNEDCEQRDFGEFEDDYLVASLDLERSIDLQWEEITTSGFPRVWGRRKWRKPD